MIQVVTNALGSSDWIVVKDQENVLWEGHRITAQDLADILNAHTSRVATLVEITDTMMEEGDY